MLKENCLIIAGEKSGEEHVMSFLPDIKRSNPSMNFFGVGGDEMSSLGVDLVYHLRDFSSWGISGVIQKVPFYYKAADKIISEVKKRNCKWAILVDFQTFNLKLSKRLKELGVKVLYYVAPQAWAWKSWRVKPLSENVHTLFTILPFEKKWFQERGVFQVKSVAHPLCHHYRDKFQNRNILSNEKDKKSYSNMRENCRVLFLPGSRDFEVKNLLPEFVDSIKKLSKGQSGIVLSPNVHKNLYDPFLKYFDFVWTHEELSRALEWAHFAVAASGTVTLTCALFEVPTVVCYSTSLLNEFIFHNFVSYDWYISLANIVHNEMIFPELIQEKVTSFNILNCLNNWILDQNNYSEVKERLSKTRPLLGGEVSNVGEFMAKIIGEKKVAEVEY